MCSILLLLRLPGKLNEPHSLFLRLPERLNEPHSLLLRLPERLNVPHSLLVLRVSGRLFVLHS